MSTWTPGYVEVEHGFDAEFCPDPVPSGYQWCMVYAGGSSAAHPWDSAELARVAHLPRLPVWVPTPGTDNPVTAAAELMAWLRGHKVPAGTHVMWDMETGQEPDPQWLGKAADAVRKAGWLNLIYGSVSSIFGQPRRDGYVVANPTGQPHMYAAANVRATQYSFNVTEPGGQIDQDLMAVDLVRQLWKPTP